MAKDYVEFMGTIIGKGHASPVPIGELTGPQSGRVWYLPHLKVYHPKKPTQIRVVFDSWAEYEGVSLNGELLSGPDLNDGLTSRPTTKEAIDLVNATQAMLSTANLKLHKVISNSVEVMEAFPAEDRGKGVRDLDLRHDSLPAQRSLGVYWNLEEDTFTFKICLPFCLS